MHIGKKIRFFPNNRLSVSEMTENNKAKIYNPNLLVISFIISVCYDFEESRISEYRHFSDGLPTVFREPETIGKVYGFRVRKTSFDQ